MCYFFENGIYDTGVNHSSCLLSFLRNCVLLVYSIKDPEPCPVNQYKGGFSIIQNQIMRNKLLTEFADFIRGNPGFFCYN